MAIGLKTIWTLRITPRHQSIVRGLNSDTVWSRGLIENNLMYCMYRTRVFWSTHMLPRHHKQYIRILVQQIITPHQSMPHHRSMSHHRSIYVNSVVNSNVDSTVYVNSTVRVNSIIFPFILLLRFSTVLSSKVMSVLPFNLSFIVKWLWCP